MFGACGGIILWQGDNAHDLVLDGQMAKFSRGWLEVGSHLNFMRM
jgi:hypothetical protein|tara:strand:- start:243 stop:377 length:135 start_codon:yes stop_codon:yes gene_type:complete